MLNNSLSNLYFVSKNLLAIFTQFFYSFGIQVLATMLLFII